MSYNPSDVGVKGSLFGFPYTLEEPELVILPVPWDVTTSFGSGTVNGPVAIMENSPQLDLSLYHIDSAWTFKTVMKPIPHEVLHVTRELRPIAEKIIERLEAGEKVSDTDDLRKVNEGTAEMVKYVYEQSKEILEDGRLCAVLGGDHSTPLGFMKALSENYQYGILQIDAHMDLRKAYEGFTHSHASIMYNAMQLPNVLSLVQVGIRDFCEEEINYIEDSKKSIHVFYNDQIKSGVYHGVNWSDWVSNIVKLLPDHVYVSFDIDGLTPDHCPNTGTPVPGGLDFDQAMYLIEEVVRSGKRIIGFDLCEVCPGEDGWDATVGARVLYRLCTYMGVSQDSLKFNR
jgi:agmatinase